MSVLPVAGARLHYETRGSGPILVMIHGASGDARIFTAIADYLAEHYTVLTYDRRGFSRSPLDGPQDYDHRLETDADDVHRLVEHHGGTPAVVFGTSSGAVVALTVLTRHPSAVRAVAAYEPAAITLLPNRQSWIDFIGDLYDLYRRSGVGPALEAFREHVLTPTDRQFLAAMGPGNAGEHVHANATYWFERELRQYSAVEPDLEALGAHAERIVLLVGQESRGYPAYQVNVELGRRLGREVIEVPGGHTAAATHPAELARAVHHALTPHQAEDPLPGGGADRSAPSARA